MGSGEEDRMGWCVCGGWEWCPECSSRMCVGVSGYYGDRNKDRVIHCYRNVLHAVITLVTN